MARETGVQSQLESYQRLRKWYLIPPSLTLSIKRYESRIRWSNPGKGVVPSSISRCSSNWKESQLYLYIYIYIYIYCYAAMCPANYHVLAFWLFIPQYQSWSQVYLSPLTHTWLIECGVFSCPYELVLIETVEERRPFFPLLTLAYYYSRLGQRVAPPSLITRWMYEGVGFPRHNIYIYIYG